MESAQSAEARSKVYRLVAYVYNWIPDAEFIEKLRLGLSEIQACPVPSTEEATRWEQNLLGALEKVEAHLKEPEEEGALLALAVERTRLFRGIRPDYGPPPPYESVYKGEGLVMGHSSTEVAECYRQTGYSLPEGWRDPPDYIGAELDFMSYLCQKEAEAWTRGDERQARAWQQQQQDFLSQHLMLWVPTFCQEVMQQAQSDMFRDLVQITNCFLELERVRGAGSEPGAASQRASI
jgi:TorA maturation chaperone TorD